VSGRARSFAHVDARSIGIDALTPTGDSRMFEDDKSADCSYNVRVTELNLSNNLGQGDFSGTADAGRKTITGTFAC
jgi:hypothetical protein